MNLDDMQSIHDGGLLSSAMHGRNVLTGKPNGPDNRLPPRLWEAFRIMLQDRYRQATGGAHLENLGGNAWFLECRNADGSSTAIWFTSKDLKRPTMEHRTPGTATRRAEALSALIEFDRDLL